MGERAGAVNRRPDVLGFVLIVSVDAPLRMRLARSVAWQTGLTPVSTVDANELRAALQRADYEAAFVDLTTSESMLSTLVDGPSRMRAEASATRRRVTCVVGVLDAHKAAAARHPVGLLDGLLAHDYTPSAFAALLSRLPIVSIGPRIPGGHRMK
jgi:type VI protein secretion system component VasK